MKTITRILERCIEFYDSASLYEQVDILGTVGALFLSVVIAAGLSFINLTWAGLFIAIIPVIMLILMIPPVVGWIILKITRLVIGK